MLRFAFSDGEATPPSLSNAKKSVQHDHNDFIMNNYKTNVDFFALSIFILNAKKQQINE